MNDTSHRIVFFSVKSNHKLFELKTVILNKTFSEPYVKTYALFAVRMFKTFYMALTMTMNLLHLHVHNE